MLVLGNCFHLTVWSDAAILRHMGDFSKPCVLFSMRFIYCWAIFGQNFYLVVAFEASVFSKWLFIAKIWALFNSNTWSHCHLIPLVSKVQRHRSLFSTSTFVFCAVSGIDDLVDEVQALLYPKEETKITTDAVMSEAPSSGRHKCKSDDDFIFCLNARR